MTLGTNYEVLCKKYKNNGFKFYNKELGITYVYIDRKLDDNVHLEEIVRSVGDNVDYFKYTSIDDFICVIKYASKDKNGCQSVDCYIVDDSNTQNLIEYTKLKKKNEDNADIEKHDVFDGDEYTDSPEFIAKLKEKEEEEIKSQIENYKGSDYSVIDFPLSDSFVYQISSKPYSCVLPDNVHHFDEGEYIRRVLEEEKNAEKRLAEEIRSCEEGIENNYHETDIEEDDIKDNDSYDNEEFEAYEEFEPDEELEFDEDSECSDDLDYNDNDDTNCEEYKINHNRKEEHISEEDIICMATSDALDAQIEINELIGFCNDIELFAKKVKTIIYGRKKKFDSQGDTFGNTNREKSDKNTKFDRDI